MELLKVIKEQDINPTTSPHSGIQYRLRKAARAIVFDSKNNIALLNVSRKNYHKLPGGGIEKGEDIKKSLSRECLEEIGCDISLTEEIGRIIEYRDKIKMKQESYCYLARLVGEKGEPNFTKKEINHGFKIIWVNLNKAIELIKNDKPINYGGSFIVVRDLIFLEEAKKLV